MRRRAIITVLAAAGLLLTGAAAAAGNALAPAQEKLYHYELRRDLSVYFSNADQVIAAIRRNLKRHDWHIVVNYRSGSNNMDDIAPLVRELMNCALSETDDPCEGDYIRCQYGGYELKYSYSLDGGDYVYKLEMIPDYYTDPEQEEKVTELVDSTIDSFAFSSGTGSYERFKAVYDFVYSHVDYDYVHRSHRSYHLKSTAFGALVYGRATCQGYAVLMYRLLREAGVNARVVTGTAYYEDGEEYHAWNLVELDGLWYNVDVMWNKQDSTEDYLLKSDGDFPAHERSEEFAAAEFYAQYPMSPESYNTD